MEWQHTVYIYPMLFSAVISTALVFYGTVHIYRNGRQPVTLAFVGLNVTIAIWTALTAIKVLSLDPAVKLFTFKLFHLGSTFASPLFLVFALAYTDNDEWLTPPILAVTFTVPTLTLLALFLNPNSVAIIDWELVTHGGVTTLEVQSGPASVARIAYGLVLDLLAVAVVVRYALRSGWSYRHQAAFLLAGIAPPAVVVFLELSDVYPPGGVGVNLLPASLAFTSVGFGVAVFRYKLFDVVPLGYRTAVEHSPNGIVVLDEDERIRYANETARASFERGQRSIGEKAKRVLPEYEDVRTGAEPVTIDLAQADGRSFDVRRRPVERHDSTVGWLVSMNDVTQQRAYQRSLQEQNDRLEAFADVVSHDLRNPLNVAQIYVNRALEEGSGGSEVNGDDDSLVIARTALTRIENIIGDVLALARQRQPIEEYQPIRLSSSVEEAWEMVDTADATLHVESDLTFEGAGDRLQRLFENLFRNAVEHGSTSPRSHAHEDAVEHGSTSNRPSADNAIEHGSEDVTVRVGPLDDGSGFYVADDGPGIPEEERDEVFESGYTTRSDGTGFGLSIVSEIVDAHDWTVTVVESDLGGARFEISGVDAQARVHDPVL